MVERLKDVLCGLSRKEGHGKMEDRDHVSGMATKAKSHCPSDSSKAQTSTFFHNLLCDSHVSNQNLFFYFQFPKIGIFILDSGLSSKSTPPPPSTHWCQ